MRIGLIAPPWVTVPPSGYGGTEAVVDNLARGLMARGHAVRLFTLGESTCPVPVDFLFRTARHPMGATVEEMAHVLAAYDALDDVDIIHDHTVAGPLVAAALGRPTPPVITTTHGAFTGPYRRIFAAISRHAAVVAISHDQARHAAGVPITAVVHHGIDVDAYRPGTGQGGHLAFVGRMSPDKGVREAVLVAHASQRPLVLAAKMRELDELEYFRKQVEPLLTKDDELVIEPQAEERQRIMGEAIALVNPITWPEPFGLVMAEALASGTPVLAFTRGAAPEIVDNGVTGYLCRNRAQMVRAVDRLGAIDRRACRQAAERRFSISAMTTRYLAVYAGLLAERGAVRGDGPDTWMSSTLGRAAV